MVAQKDGFGQAGYTALKAELAKRNMQLAGEAWYDRVTGDTSEAATAMTKVNADAVILIAISKPAATFLKKFRDQGGTSQVYGLSAIQYDDVIRAVGKSSASGLGLSQVFPAPTNAQLKVIRDFQKDAEPFLKADEYPTYALLEGYMSARILVEALKRAGKNPNRASVFFTALSNMKKFDLGGYSVDFSNPRRNGSNFVELTMISPTGTLSR